MQKLYWRPTRVSRFVHILVALIAVGTLLVAERFQVVSVQPYFDEKLAATHQMARAVDILRNHRIRNVAAVDAEVDPTRSGLIGLPTSSVTTNSGSLEAKRTTANPNWAAVVVDLYQRAGVERGDLIALGVSGSFPALNLAALVAAEELGLEVISIASAGASSWGANIPGFSWLDMERILMEADILSEHSVAASLGGMRDRALGMSRRGKESLRDTIRSNNVAFLETKDEESSIVKRIQTYAVESAGRRFAAYVNVGGSLVSIGPKSVKRLYRPGLNLKPHPRGAGVDSVMIRFLQDGVPVINLSKVIPLAERYGLPVEPEELPKVGEGTVFEKREHSRPLVFGMLAFLLASLYGLLKLELGARIVALSGGSAELERTV